MYGLSALVVLGVMHVLPIKPISAQADQPLQIGNFQLDEIGWPATVADVEDANRALPPPSGERSSAGVMIGFRPGVGHC